MTKRKRPKPREAREEKPVESPPQRSGVRRVGLLVVAVAVAVIVFFVYDWYVHRRLTESIVRSRQALLAGEWPELQRWGDRWTRLAPSDPEGWLMLAEACKQQRDWLQMVECLDHVTIDDPQLTTVLLDAGDKLVEQARNVVMAERIYLRVIDLDAANATAFDRLGFLYSRSMQHTKWLKLLRAAMEQKCESANTFYYVLGGPNLRFESGLAMTLVWLEATPEYEPLQAALAIHTFNQPATKATHLFDWSHLENADPQVLADALNKHPKNFELHVAWLDHLIDQGKLDQAVSWLPNLPDNKEDSRYWRLQGWASDVAGELEQSEAHFQRALTVNPMDWLTRNQLAEVQRVRGQVELAAENATLSLQGKELQRDFGLNVYNTDPEIVDPLLRRLRDHAMACDDRSLVERIDERLAERRAVSSKRVMSNRALEPLR